MKVRCVENRYDEAYFTIGKVYDFNDAGVVDDTQDNWDIHLRYDGESPLDKWKRYYASEFRAKFFEEIPSIEVSAESYNVTSENFNLIAANDAIYGEPDFWDCFDYAEAKAVLYVLKNIPHDNIDEFIEVVEKCIELKGK